MFNTPFDYPDRVTKQPDGSYKWKCRIEKEYERRSYKLTIIICSAIAVFVLIYGAVLSAMYRQSMLIVIACVAVFMVITLLICFGLDRLPGQRLEIYSLTDEDIHTGSGRSGAYFRFKRTKELILGKGYIELRGPFGGPRIYVPEEDMDFVRSYIRSRMPEEVIMRYYELDE